MSRGKRLNVDCRILICKTVAARTARTATPGGASRAVESAGASWSGSYSSANARRAAAGAARHSRAASGNYSNAASRRSRVARSFVPTPIYDELRHIELFGALCGHTRCATRSRAWRGRMGRECAGNESGARAHAPQKSGTTCGTDLSSYLQAGVFNSKFSSLMVPVSATRWCGLGNAFVERRKNGRLGAKTSDMRARRRPSSATAKSRTIGRRKSCGISPIRRPKRPNGKTSP